MSTSSFLRDIELKDKKKVAALVDALERSKSQPKREVKLSRPVREVRGEELITLLPKIKW